MKIASVSGVGVIILGVLIGNAPVTAGSLDHMVVVSAPAGFERIVDEVATIHLAARQTVHHVTEPVSTPRGSGQVAAEARAERPVATKCEPSDTSRAVLDKENESFERPLPNTNVFGKW